jgi:hypothetical protein
MCLQEPKKIWKKVKKNLEVGMRKKERNEEQWTKMTMSMEREEYICIMSFSPMGKMLSKCEFMVWDIECGIGMSEKTNILVLGLNVDTLG